MVTHIVDDTEGDLDAVRICFPFTVAGFMIEVYSSTGAFLEGLTDLFTATANRVEADGTGGNNPVAGDIVRCLAWS
jgi:hypothetical protein